MRGREAWLSGLPGEAKSLSKRMAIVEMRSNKSVNSIKKENRANRAWNMQEPAVYTALNCLKVDEKDGILIL